MSQTTIATNMLIMLRYWMRIETVAKRQKLRIASIDEIIPSANAAAVVNDVIVMAGPAFDKPSWTR